MSRHLKGGTTADLSDQGILSLAGTGFQYMTGLTGGEVVKGAQEKLTSALGGGGGAAKEKRPKTTFAGGYDEGDDDFEDEGEEEEDYDDDEDEDEEIDAQLAEEEREAEGADEDDEEFEDEGLLGSQMFSRAGKAVLDVTTRRKTFLCDIHTIRITNIARRRRDVQVILTLGEVPGQGGAAAAELVSASDVEPELDGDGDDGADEAAAASLGGKKRSSFLSFGRRKKDRNFRTSKKITFKSDVALKLERNKTAHLKKSFHGAWVGTYKDLPKRELHMLLVEQTRFGNLIEIGTASIPLLELATGSVQQEVTFTERDG